jgi:hypothetical protein
MEQKFNEVLQYDKLSHGPWTWLQQIYLVWKKEAKTVVTHAIVLYLCSTVSYILLINCNFFLLLLFLKAISHK